MALKQVFYSNTALLEIVCIELPEVYCVGNNIINSRLNR